jgi:dihydrofolate synthase/folylpolyglutamate synthase
MNYEEAINYITNTAKFGMNFGLERTQKILELLGNPHKKIKCIHIAGTNGKGSTTAMITKILMETGLKVGMYTSPYLEVFEERIQINNENICKEDLCKSVTQVSKAVTKVIELGYDNPTEFEIITCTMFCYFFDKKVDFAVIEVGLGGRLDSTNILQPFSVEEDGGVIASVIVSISHDHMKILGDTLEKIAYEKAGIIKKGIPVIMYPQKPEVEKIIEKMCLVREAKLIKVPIDSVKYLEGDNKNIDKNTTIYAQRFKVTTDKDKYDIQLSLLGKHQLLNCATAIFAIEELIRKGIGIKKEHILSALKKVRWIGRLEVMKSNPLVVIDGAHNIDGIANLKENVQNYFKYNKMILVLGILADKEVDKMVSIIAPLANRVITVTPNSDRAESSKELKEIVEKYDVICEAIESYSEAYKLGMSYCSEEDLLLVSGSLYMIGDMRKIISKS